MESSRVLLIILFLAAISSIIYYVQFQSQLRFESKPNDIQLIESNRYWEKSRHKFKPSKCAMAGSDGHWRKTDVNILPLHDFPSQCQFKDKPENSSYFNESGVMRHLAKNRLVSFDSKHLKYIWHSNHCRLEIYNSSDVIRFAHSNLWIHFEGDSVARSMFNDLLNYFHPCSKRGYYGNVGPGHSFQKDNITVSYVPNNINILSKTCPNFHFSQFKNIKKKAPDVLIVNFGLWYSRYSDEKKRISLKYSHLINCANKYAKHLIDTLNIFRLSTPSTNKNWGMKEKQYNEIAVRYLDKSLWQIVDFFPMLHDRFNVLSDDKIHFPIIGSNWMTNILLNIIEELMIRK